MFRMIGGAALAVAFTLFITLSAVADGDKDQDQWQEPGKGAHLQMLFKKLDTNQDGALSPEEFQELAQLLQGGAGGMQQGGMQKGGGR